MLRVRVRSLFDIVLFRYGFDAGRDHGNFGALVTFKVGTVRSSGGEVEIGQLLGAGSEVSLADNSSADLQLISKSQDALVRLQANSTYTIFPDPTAQGLVIRSRLRKGEALFEVRPLKTTDRFEIEASSLTASVRGTKLMMSELSGRSTVSVQEGSVFVTARIPEAADLPPGLIQEAPVLRAVHSVLAEFGVTVEPGRSVSVGSQLSREILASAPDFALALQRPALVAVRGRWSASDQEIQAATAALTEAYPNPQRIAALVATIRRLLSDKPMRMAQARPNQLQEQLARYDDLLRLEVPQGVVTDSVRADLGRANAIRREKLMQKIENIMGQSAETLVLEDGRRIRGIVIAQAEQYIVLTPDGRSTHPRKTVKRVEF